MEITLEQNQVSVFKPRNYQLKAIKAGVDFFAETNSKKNGFIVLPTGSGKSVVIANIALSLNNKTIVLQPSKEILEQNVAKFRSYGYDCGVFSASMGVKDVKKITFATIGSVMNSMGLFIDVEHIIIDECHLVNAKGGMYEQFIKMLPKAKVLGLTATPYRLSTSSFGAVLKFINRTRPRIFNDLIYYVQNNELFDNGYLCKLNYYAPYTINRSMLEVNSTGSDYTDRSVKALYESTNFYSITADIANRLLAKRKNLLVFCTLIYEARLVADKIKGAVVITGDTPKAERERILNDFKNGNIRCVLNVGVLTTGFDFPELEAVLIARSTMSLALYYQMVGRGMRPSPNKENCWIVDLGGNYKYFGAIETMQIKQYNGLYALWNNGKQLTNVNFEK